VSELLLAMIKTRFGDTVFNIYDQEGRLKQSVRFVVDEQSLWARYIEVSPLLLSSFVDRKAICNLVREIWRKNGKRLLFDGDGLETDVWAIIDQFPEFRVRAEQKMDVAVKVGYKVGLGRLEIFEKIRVYMRAGIKVIVVSNATWTDLKKRGKLLDLMQKKYNVHFSIIDAASVTTVDPMALPGVTPKSAESSSDAGGAIQQRHGGIDLKNVQDKLIIKRGPDWEPLPIEMQDLPFLKEQLKGLTPILIQQYPLPNVIPLLV